MSYNTLCSEHFGRYRVIRGDKMPIRLTNFIAKVCFVYMHRLSCARVKYVRGVSACSLSTAIRRSRQFTHIYSEYNAESYVSFLLHWYFPMRFIYFPNKVWYGFPRLRQLYWGKLHNLCDLGLLSKYSSQLTP